MSANPGKYDSPICTELRKISRDFREDQILFTRWKGSSFDEALSKSQ